MKTTIALACVALAFLANADTFQPMASRALVERRISESNSNLNARIHSVHTNMIARIASFRNEVAELIAGENDDYSSVDAWRLNMNVGAHLLSVENSSTLTNVAEYICDATDKSYSPAFLVWDGVERNPYCATNPYSRIACWDSVSGNTHSYRITTYKGETYTNSVRAWGADTFFCTTNEARIIKVERTRVDGTAYNMIMGL